MSTPTAEQIFKAVEAQRQQLLNVFGAVQCISIAVTHGPPPELDAAVALVEDRLQNILEELEELNLEKAIAAQAEAEAAEAQP